MSDTTYHTQYQSNHITNQRSFILAAYSHLLLGLFMYFGFSVVLFVTGLYVPILNLLFSNNIVYIMVIIGFGAVSTFAHTLAYNANNKLIPYIAMIIYTAAMAIVFIPMIILGLQAGVMLYAASYTVILFVLLSVIALTTSADFSFLRSIIIFGGIGAFIVVIFASIFGASLGIWFSAAMILLAGASILYETQSILRVYSNDQYAAAGLALTASILTLFFYIIRLLAQLRD